MKVLTNLATEPMKVLLTTLAALGMALGLQAQTAQPTTTKAVYAQAKVQAIQGSAFYTPKGGKPTALRVGMLLTPGATIQTGPKSRVDLFLGKMAGMVRITEKTKLSLDNYSLTQTGADPVFDVQLGLPEGTILGTVNKLSAASKYSIKTPDGVAGVRGTEFTIEVRNGRTLAIRTSSGTVIFVAVQALAPGQPLPTPAPGSPASASIRQADGGQLVYTITDGAQITQPAGGGTPQLQPLNQAEAAAALQQLGGLSTALQDLTAAMPGGQIVPGLVTVETTTVGNTTRTTTTGQTAEGVTTQSIQTSTQNADGTTSTSTQQTARAVDGTTTQTSINATTDTGGVTRSDATQTTTTPAGQTSTTSGTLTTDALGVTTVTSGNVPPTVVDIGQAPTVIPAPPVTPPPPPPPPPLYVPPTEKEISPK
jgi:hypothetical protein